MATETNLLDLPVGTKVRVCASPLTFSKDTYVIGGPFDAQYRIDGHLGVEGGGWILPDEIEEVLELPAKQVLEDRTVSATVESAWDQAQLRAAEQEVNLASAKYALAAGGGVRLGFAYMDANDEYSYRHVVPTEVKESHNNLLIVANDVTDEQLDHVRTFRLDRIVGVCEIEFRF